MANRTVKTLLVVTLVVVLGSILFSRSIRLHPDVTHPSVVASASPAGDNLELARLYDEDQSDRTPEDKIDWKVVGPRDKAREARAKQLYTGDMLQSGADYYHVAMILQHAEAPEDYLLAHELCVVSVTKGNQDAKWLAAASEDRFLMSIGRPQRFGTQYQAAGPNGDFQLYKMEPGVTDVVRRAMNVPSPKQH
jgi:hypothetical protein